MINWGRANARRSFGQILLFLGLLPALLSPVFSKSKAPETAPPPLINASASPSEPDQTQSPVQNYKTPMERAIEVYKSGRTKEAIEAFTKITESEPQNLPAKDYLIEALIVSTMESFLIGNEDEAYNQLNIAMEIAPNPDSLRKIYDKVKMKYYKSQTGTDTTVIEKMIPLGKLEKKLIDNQNKILSTTLETLSGMAKNSEVNRDAILKTLGQQETSLRKYSTGLYAGGAGGIILAILIALLLTQRYLARREKLFLQQGENFIHQVQLQTEKALEHFSQKVRSLPPGANDGAGLLENNSASKLKRIDIIDCEVVQEKSEPEQTNDHKVIETLLEDPDPQVRARAIQVLVKYDQDQAIHRIEDLLGNTHSGVRLIGIKLLQGIATENSAKMLIKLLAEDDVKIKKEAIRALKTLSDENLDDLTKEKINMALQEVSDKEGWFIK